MEIVLYYIMIRVCDYLLIRGISENICSAIENSLFQEKDLFLINAFLCRELQHLIWSCYNSA